MATTRDVTSFGALGDGSHDDTAAIRNAISALVPGDTLLFPCTAGNTYLTTSQLVVNVSNITIDGSGCARIFNTSTSSSPIFRIGQGGNTASNAALGAAIALSATATELSNSFTTVSSLGVLADDYVYLSQGGKDGNASGSGATTDTQCDLGGCRGEIVKVASVNGNTVTVTTALHDTYDPSVNAAVAKKVNGMLSGITVRNITFDGNSTNNYGLQANDIADSTFTGITSQNVLGAAIITSVAFNVTWSDITITHAGSAGCGGAFHMDLQGNPSISGMSLSQLNSAPSICLNNGSFGWNLGSLAGGTFSNITVDKTGTGGGRPVKLDSARWSTFNTLSVTGGSGAYNGLTIEYYSSHNTFNNCVITNNAGGSGSGNAGINSFGNFNQYNAFNNCTVSGNGNVQILINNFDDLRLGQDSNVTINGTTISGPGVGLVVNASNACINNNTFVAGSGLTAGISALNGTDVGSGNVLNGYSSNLALGSCGTASPPLPPTNLTATVQ